MERTNGNCRFRYNIHYSSSFQYTFFGLKKYTFKTKFSFTFWVSFCLFSKCRSYRWILKRELLSGKKTIIFIGLNPSRASSSFNDRTLIRIINFASRWSYKDIYIINLFGLVSKSSLQLSKSNDPIGGNNDLITLKSLEFWRKNNNCDLWLGWGDKGQLLSLIHI